MDLNKSLINKIENIIKLTSNFDKICSSILSGDINLNNKNIKDIKELTNLYISIRAEHGNIIILNDKMKKDLEKKSENAVNKLYDLSTFTSIIDNINNLVSNTDFEFKKIALIYPQMINKETTHLILIIKKADMNNKFIKMFEEIKKLKPEHEYHIINCEEKETKIDCSNLIGIKLTLGIKKLPSIYLVNEANVVELPIKNINNINDLVKLLD
jgi:hypothetical protein